ncbi:hypothetical protein BDP27DRAFT_309510 [Rhodocollybia butyracea]|uniref:Uncharacterized protein n=1 Tax=Rhodocollybia butyracea TaxID=206335 RepID=A0A9P5U1U4_9AGAR|nr:hypothetical protein BDP27DRAFT_309510 [Rhodocollybia butyracea]
MYKQSSEYTTMPKDTTKPTTICPYGKITAKKDESTPPCVVFTYKTRPVAFPKSLLESYAETTKLVREVFELNDDGVKVVFETLDLPECNDGVRIEVPPVTWTHVLPGITRISVETREVHRYALTVPPIPSSNITSSRPRQGLVPVPRPYSPEDPPRMARAREVHRDASTVPPIPSSTITTSRPRQGLVPVPPEDPPRMTLPQMSSVKSAYIGLFMAYESKTVPFEVRANADLDKCLANVFTSSFPMLNRQDFRFSCGGYRIHRDHTPRALRIKDGDIVNVF